ncbi:hypothetical protein HA464_36460 (plasmid) [Rhizobium leguminosarum bv. trifolii]|uniref:hypothetical protein n=1 Tax=Rhizobium ruizarguesonis TaxID=2081791 RepID=UPI0003FFCD6D|nr:hypothetical protein [Rhizobium ruizarguesonis]NEJ23873.1 hypothetical protein [Rhizobium leguminosarum]QIO49426.1 hypothetical protein HA464_36460 [Rhizobium leguminosarum bv. trifolii]QJS32728.1 hypothetical protein RLTA1_36895 [Rhizobium leguminosarum bv. trifolii TA1]QND37757.1 hypothetical protein HB771_05430 [Rhizobium leguminosarum bv. viciae]TAT71345.1 hypothetical protein ELI56_33730 [Rhizobium ruizarguesonis]
MFDDGKDVGAELSRPIEFRGGFYVGYSERIWIIRPGEWERIEVENPADDDGQDFDITVRRK